MPSARFHEEGTIAFNYSNFEPYQRLALIAYPFDFLETIYQYTDIKNYLYSPVFAFSGNQTYKDKGFDVKLRLFQESDYLPSLAVGFRDIAGTGIFSSEYLVATKNYKNIDFTMGLGWGILNQNGFKNPLTRIKSSFEQRGVYSGGQGGEISTNSFFRGKDAGLFSGLEIFIPHIQGLRLKLEYDATDYGSEGFTAIDQSSNINYGLTYAANNFFQFSISAIRGNEIQFGFSLVGSFGNKASVTAKKDGKKSIKNADIYRKVNSNPRFLYLSSLDKLKEESIYLRSLNIDANSLSVAFAQNKHASYPRAYGRAIHVLDQISPPDVTEFTLIPMNANFELAHITIPRSQYNQYKLTNDYVLLAESMLISPPIKDLINEFEYTPESTFPYFYYTLGPAIQSHIGGADRFYAGALNMELNSEILLQRNIGIQLIARQTIADTFDILDQPSDSILPHVRTDLIDYLQGAKGFSLVRLQGNIFHQPFPSIYTKLSAGVFEEMFGGFGGEVLYRDFSSNWAIGFEAYKVRQRSFRQLFNFKQYEITTGHATFYYQEPATQVLFKLVGGRFLAGDSGVTIDLSRRFKSGLRLGAFFSLTDISKEEFGEGSFDKGFYMHFPIEALFTNYSKKLSYFGLKPLTRDGAARLISGHSLYGVTDESNAYNIERDIADIYD